MTLDELAPYMRGWRSYFGFCETLEVLVVLTRWVRLRLRAALWRQWKTGELRNTASSGLGPWPLARSKALCGVGSPDRRWGNPFSERSAGSDEFVALPLEARGRLPNHSATANE
jgi:hypothetical protein